MPSTRSSDDVRPPRPRTVLDRHAEALARDGGRAALRAIRTLWGMGADAASATANGHRPGNGHGNGPVNGRGAGPGAGAAGRANGRPLPDRVGIWKLVKEGAGSPGFVRDSSRAADWGLWADVHRIAPKGARPRVVLLGESVARGYFYEPAFTLAHALQQTIDGALGVNRVEVVDLACAGIKLPALVSLIESVPALEPDAVVLFAGNNWRAAKADALSSARRCALADALFEGGLERFRDQCEATIREDVTAGLARIADVFNARQIPVVLVVPEFNLVDWREWHAVPGWLPGNGNAEWWQAWQDARAARDAGDGETAARLAERMRELDRGTCPQASYLLADRALAEGRRQEARALLEQARDSCVWDPSPFISPRAFSVIQNTLRTEGARHRLHVVDLPKEFDAALPDGLPDRRLFLDYCHLTIEGMRIAMAATAAEVVPLTARVPVSPAALNRVRLTVPKAAEGAAHFGAAIHNGHWGQQRGAVEYHCARAVDTHGDVARIMEDYLDLAGRRAPAWMNGAFDRMASRDQLTLVRYILTMLPFQPERVDPFLAGRVARALGPADEGRLESMWCEEYAGNGVRTPLHQPRFAVGTLGHREAFTLVHCPRGWPAFLRAYSPTTAFTLIEDGPRAVDLRLTARRPAECTAGGEVAVHVNGECVLRAPLEHRWTTVTVTVPAEHIKRGINEVTVHWPPAHWDSRAGLTRATEDIETSVIPELVPTFGEIHSLWAANGA